VVEVVRWGRESVEEATETVRNVLDDSLTSSAEKAVRGAILRSIFPSGNPDPVNARMHFSIVEQYLRQVEGRVGLIQRASGVLVQRYLASWNQEMEKLTGSGGAALKMDESARMTAAMVQDELKYSTFERTPCDPADSWSPGFLKVIDEMGRRPRLQKKFILLLNAKEQWGDQVAPAKRDESKELFFKEADYLQRRGFQIYFCDERSVHKELATTDLPQGNFEIFSDQVALQMDAAETYDRQLITRLHVLSDIGELRRFIEIVENLATKVSPRIIKNATFVKDGLKWH
jgi:hypothetical protein